MGGGGRDIPSMDRRAGVLSLHRGCHRHPGAPPVAAGARVASPQIPLLSAFGAVGVGSSKNGIMGVPSDVDVLSVGCHGLLSRAHASMVAVDLLAGWLRYTHRLGQLAGRSREVT